jgi:hypothetical protein
MLFRKEQQTLGMTPSAVYMILKVTSKVVPVHIIKEYRGSTSTAPLILNLGAR